MVNGGQQSTISLNLCEAKCNSVSCFVHDVRYYFGLLTILKSLEFRITFSRIRTAMEVLFRRVFGGALEKTISIYLIISGCTDCVLSCMCTSLQ